MSSQQRPLNQMLLDQEVPKAVGDLRKVAHENFVQDKEQIRQLAELLVSWNEALIHEVDVALAKYENSRSVLLSKLAAASNMYANDSARVSELTSQIVNATRPAPQHTNPNDALMVGNPQNMARDPIAARTQDLNYALSRNTRARNYA